MFTLLAIASLLVLAGNPGTDCDSFSFDRAGWLDQAANAGGPTPEENRATPRFRLAAGLEDCNLLDGKTKPEVGRMLGPADDSEPRLWSYQTGVLTALGDTKFFYVEFDSSGRVRSVDAPD